MPPLSHFGFALVLKRFGYEEALIDHLKLANRLFLIKFCAHRMPILFKRNLQKR